MCIFEKIQAECTNWKADLDMTQTIQKGSLSVQGKEIWTTTIIGRNSQSGPGKHLYEAPDIFIRASVETQIHVTGGAYIEHL